MRKLDFFLLLSVPHRPPRHDPRFCRLAPEHSAEMSSQRKSRHHVDLPPPTVTSDARADLDKALGEILYTTYDWELAASVPDCVTLSQTALGIVYCL